VDTTRGRQEPRPFVAKYIDLDPSATRAPVRGSRVVHAYIKSRNGRRLRTAWDLKERRQEHFSHTKAMERSPMYSEDLLGNYQRHGTFGLGAAGAGFDKRGLAWTSYVANDSTASPLYKNPKKGRRCGTVGQLKHGLRV